MDKNFLELHICIAGSHDFVRRMNTAAEELNAQHGFARIRTYCSNLAELKSAAIEFRPQVLLFDLGLRTAPSDVAWLKQTLFDLRERSGKGMYTIAAITAPEKFALAGHLLFAGEDTLNPSGLIENLMFSPPQSFPFAPPLEAQLRDCLFCLIELLADTPKGINPLPALGESAWAPSMADPQSRSVWMRWLPRYARYVNENPLIVGPTGSGKTKLASALHELSDRKGPFISITPRDFSSTELVQAELFGAVAGAYTGAVDKWGLVKKAEKGTLFIDELQSIDLDLQGKLITFIENKSYRRVGEAESHTADVRFVFATNRSLQSLVAEGRLRDDFAYRLERLQLILKPLEERRLDIAAGICVALAKVLRERAGARAAVQHANSRATAAPEGLTQGAYARLFGASWPGNLRQLENTVAKLIEVTSLRGKALINEECVAEALEGMLGAVEMSGSDILSQAALTAGRKAAEERLERLDDLVARVEDFARFRALETCGGNIQQAAALIGDSAGVLQRFVTARSQS